MLVKSYLWGDVEYLEAGKHDGDFHENLCDRRACDFEAQSTTTMIPKDGLRVAEFKTRDGELSVRICSFCLERMYRATKDSEPGSNL